MSSVLRSSVAMSSPRSSELKSLMSMSLEENDSKLEAGTAWVSFIFSFLLSEIQNLTPSNCVRFKIPDIFIRNNSVQ